MHKFRIDLYLNLLKIISLFFIACVLEVSINANPSFPQYETSINNNALGLSNCFISLLLCNYYQ